MLRRACGALAERLEERRLLAGTIYVDANPGIGAHDGGSWDTAYADLQQALGAAVSGDTIKVADGTYKSTSTTDRTISFNLKDGVGIYGGYAGYGASDPEARDVTVSQTVLSGDIGTVGSNTDNSYHVVAATSVGSSTVLDGVTISAGNANGGGTNEKYGGGMLNISSSPTLANCTFEVNRATAYGGGICNLNSSSPTMTNCTFNQNTTINGFGGGGGMYNSSSSPSLIDCKFNNNKTDYDGGGIFNDSSLPTLTRCSFFGNEASNINPSTPTQGGGIYNTSSSPTLTNCTFRLNKATHGGGMLNESSSSPTLTNCTFTENSESGMENDILSSPTLTNCTFFENSATYGGGMNNFNHSSPILSNCIFSKNDAYDGGGMFNDAYSSPTLTNCTFSRNNAHNGGAIWAYNNSRPTLTNCIFSGNNATDGGAIYCYKSNVSLTNCVLSRNTAINGGTIYNDSSSPILTNCILWSNESTPIVDMNGSTTVTYCDIEGGYPGTGNINADPVFVRSPWIGPDGIWETNDDDYGDLRLRSMSPCLDKGLNSANNNSTDISGNPRILNTTIDLGAYEGSVSVMPKTLHVDVNAAGDNTGSSWANAFTSLQSAILAATDQDTIKIADGTYKPTSTTNRTISFVLKNNVGIYGGYAGFGAADPDARDVDAYPTILSGDIGVIGTNTDNSYHVVNATQVGSATVLDGVTIMMGKADGQSNDSRGGGILLLQSSLQLSHCVFLQNSAVRGGGVYSLDSSATLTDCLIKNNTAGNGGGMYINCTQSASPAAATLVRCDFMGNGAQTAPTLNEGGGGMVIANSSPILNDCTFMDNMVYCGTNAIGGGGGIINVSSSPRLIGCTFIRNTAYTVDRTNSYTCGGGILNTTSSTPTLVNCEFILNEAVSNDSSIDKLRGGGIYNNASSPIVTQCTFYGNKAHIKNTAAFRDGSGIFDEASSNPVLTNCILWNNGTRPILDYGSASKITYCDIDATLSDTGNINADPRFVRNPSYGIDGKWGTADDDFGDLRLRSNSPCIDAGNNSAVPAGITTDLDGLARFVDIPGVPDTGLGTAPIVDMGAYEKFIVGPTDILLSCSAVPEQQLAGTTVGTLSAVDADFSNPYTYELVGGEGGVDNGSFTIVGDALKTSAVFSFNSKNSYSIRVRTTDSDGLSVEKVFVITVDDVNEPPTDVALSSTNVPANQPIETAVGTLSGLDPDANDILTYSLVSGMGDADNACFAIVGNSLYTAKVFDLNRMNYSIRVRVTDAGGLFLEKALTLKVINLNKMPTSLTLSNGSVMEGQPAWTVVGVFSSTDPNDGDTATYSLVDGIGSEDNSSFVIVGNELRTNGVFSAASDSSYSIRARVTDSGGLYFTRIMTLEVTEAPKGSIKGTVYNDLDADGRVESGEKPLAKVQVYLDADNNGKYSSGELLAMTNSAGQYFFSGLNAGNYTVRLYKAPSGFRASSTTIGAGGIALGSGVNVDKQNLTLTQKALVSGTVFLDKNKNKKKDAGEGGLAGWTVFVDSDKDGVLDKNESRVLTDAGGNFSLNLPAGTFALGVVAKKGYKFSTPTTKTLSVTTKAGQVIGGKLFGVTK